MALTDALMAYWSLDETSGTRADATGRGNDATEVGTPGSAAGVRGLAASFPDDTAYLTVPTHADLSPGDTDFTWAFWVFADSLGAGINTDFFGKWSSSALEYDIFLPSSRVLEFLVSTTGSNVERVSSASFGLLSALTWYFVVAWHDAAGNTLNIQINNGAVESVAHTGGVHQGSAALVLGHSNFGASLVGRLDEVGLWHRVLTAEERSALYNGGLGLAYPFTGDTVILAATLAGQATPSAGLDVPVPLSGSSASASTLTGRLTELVPLAGASRGRALPRATLTGGTHQVTAGLGAGVVFRTTPRPFAVRPRDRPGCRTRRRTYALS
jgi:hypothetical protein